MRVKDRFGDNGLVGVMLTRTDGGVCEIDTFLLSCRVISRTVETAMLAFLAAESRVARAHRDSRLVSADREKRARRRFLSQTRL